MPNDLDLALRVRADIGQARSSFLELSNAVAASKEKVESANRETAASTMRVTRAVAELRRVRREYQANANAYTRALVAEAQASLANERASRRAAQATARKAQADRQAAIAARQAAQATDRQTEAERRNTAARAVGRGGVARSTVQIQNAAFQIQDFAVQVASGTSAARAFGQQAPQLLGGFGAVGAVIGAVLAVAIPLGAAFLNLGKESADLADTQERLADSVDRLTDLERAVADVDTLAETYGKAAGQARDLLRAQQDLAEQDARAALAAVIGGLENSFNAVLVARDIFGQSELRQRLIEQARSDADIANIRSQQSGVGFFFDEVIARLNDVLDGEDVRQLAELIGRTRDEILSDVADTLSLNDTQLDRYVAQLEASAASRLSGALNDLQERFGITEDAARRLIDAYQQLAAAEGFEAQAEAAGQLRQIVLELQSSQKDATDTQQEALTALLRGLLDLEEDALKAAAATDQIPPGLDEAAESARSLADELDRALGALRRLQTRARFRLARAQAEVDFADDPAARSAALRRIFVDEQTQDVDRRLRADPDLNALDRIAELDRARALAGVLFDTEQQALALEQAQRDAGRAGRSGASDAAREMRKLEEAQRKAREEADKLRTATRDALREYAEDALETRDEVAEAWASGFQGLEDALVTFVTTGKLTFRDLANSIIADLARIAIRQNITGPLAAAFLDLFGSGAPTSSPRPTPRPTTFHGGGNPRAAGARLPGLGPREVPAILEEGEAVITGPQARALLGIERHEINRQRARRFLEIAARYHTGGLAGLPGGALPAVPAAPAGPARQAPMNISVEVTNTGTPQRANTANARFDPRGLVVNVVLEDLDSGGPIARRMQGIIPGTQL